MKLSRNLIPVCFLLIVTLVAWHPQIFYSITHLSQVSAQEASDEAEQNNQNQEEDTISPEEEAELDAKKRKVEELQAKLKEVQGQKVTVSSTIQYINTKINLSQAEVEKTQAEIRELDRQIEDLSTRINGLEQSLDVLSDVLVDRVNQSYKRKQTNPVHMLILSEGMSDFFTKYRYLKVAETHTRDVMVQAENQKLNFDEQKELKEVAQVEVERKRAQLQVQQNQLAVERQGQQQLLSEAQNNEAKFQADLAVTLAQIEAIQGIIAGKGSEVKVGGVKQGDKIGSVIYGASPCSTGTHLHFETVRNGAHQDPASYLKPVSINWSNGPQDGPFGFGGDLEWPLNDPARITQGYGMTYYARVRRSYGGAPHTGIDMVSKSADLTVKAVKDGELYRGGIACAGKTLRYVRVIHGDGLSTYYLHVNY